MFLLFILSLALLSGFFLLPVNREWADTVLSYGNNFLEQRHELDHETRMRKRFRTHYTYSKNIADTLKKYGLQDALVLMPPHSYFKKMNVNYTVPLPPVFYYFTGMKTVWANNPHAMEADLYVRVSNGKIIIDSAASKQALQDTINSFLKLGVAL